MATNGIGALFSRKPLQVVRNAPEPPRPPIFARRLGLTDSLDSVRPAPSATQVAERRANTTINDAANSLNIREHLSEEQLNTVQSLRAKAEEIAREADPQRAAALATEASDLLANADTQYTELSDRYPELADDQLFTNPLNRSVPVGQGGRDFSTTIAGVPTLADIGVSQALSFDPASIDATVSTLTTAEDSIRSRLGQYSSSRTDLTLAVSSERERASLVESSTATPSISAVANRFATSLKSATSPLFTHRLEDLNSTTLLVTGGEDGEND